MFHFIELTEDGVKVQVNFSQVSFFHASNGKTRVAFNYREEDHLSKIRYYEESYEEVLSKLNEA